MDIRKLKPEEYRAADILDSLSFVEPMSEDEDEKSEYRTDRWGCLDDDGTLNASLTNHDLPICFDGGVAPARGVGSVASDPVSRGQGHIRALMHAVLTDDRENGQLFSVLYPFSHPFYRKFGYELCFDNHKAKFPTKALKGFRTGNPPKARMIVPKDGIEALYPIYTEFAGQYNLAVARDARTWHRREPGDPYKAEKYCYVLSRGGADTAYAIFHFRPEGKPFIRTLCLTDYAYVDVQAFHDLMRFLYRYTAQARDIEMAVPGNLPLSSLLPEPYHIETFINGRPMARAVHVERVLKAMRYPGEDGEFNIAVDDEFLPENTGCYAVRYTKEGEVSVARCAGEAGLRLSIQTFTQLALGFLDLEEAAYKPEVRISGNEAVLRQVFVKKPIFLWDFY